MNKQIDLETVRKVAAIARLRLTKEEEERFSRDLDTILEAFADIRNVETKGVKPSYHPFEAEGRLREDVPEACISQEEALSNVKAKEKGFIKAPRVV